MQRFEDLKKKTCFSQMFRTNKDRRKLNDLKHFHSTYYITQCQIYIQGQWWNKLMPWFVLEGIWSFFTLKNLNFSLAKCCLNSLFHLIKFCPVTCCAQCWPLAEIKRRCWKDEIGKPCRKQLSCCAVSSKTFRKSTSLLHDPAAQGLLRRGFMEEFTLDWFVIWLWGDYTAHWNHIIKAFYLATLPPGEFRNYGGICVKFKDMNHEGVFAPWNIFE